ncbi:hypothetical protein H105_01022 [Trichophyton soudanense CBS 452.61]|uniref:Uncharacterized protein n=1 Tax=Trichophyton soudanense CBS 452.61 TaxID=1215331 RepID=A0A022Y5I6_TRISD|nr:hypothetical protein H105_01022 [Trichophyton soudanense CBS 452.61]EZG10325.1 hypothetical protein H106_00818 [Trichophyton rubrum CBS 735.88]
MARDTTVKRHNYYTPYFTLATRSHSNKSLRVYSRGGNYRERNLVDGLRGSMGSNSAERTPYFRGCAFFFFWSTASVGARNQTARQTSQLVNCSVLRILYILVPLPVVQSCQPVPSQASYIKKKAAPTGSPLPLIISREESKHQLPTASSGRSIPLLALINNLAQKVPALALVAGSDPAQLHTHTRVSINIVTSR